MHPTRRVAVAAAVFLLVQAGMALGAPAKKPATRNAPSKKSAAGKPARPAPAKAEKEPTLDDHPLIARLKQEPNGPGIWVCEPVPIAGANEETARFGGGCARWLHLNVGGQGEFGKTARWSSAARVEKELKRWDLRLKLQDALRLQQTLGLTHAGLGEISGDLNRCALRYRIWDLRTGKPLGTAVEASGSADEVVTQLPRLAEALAIQLGAKTPVIPATVGETAAQLRVLGGLPWSPTAELPTPATDPVGEMVAPLIRSRKSDVKPPVPTVALMVLMISGGVRRVPGLTTGMGNRLLDALPENTLAAGESAMQAASMGRAFNNAAAERMKAVHAKYPQNYLLNAALSSHAGSQGRLDDRRSQAEAAVRANVRSPEAWYRLGDAIAGQAQNIRRSRVINALSPEELEKCEKLYAEWLPMTLKAVELDPDWARGWVAVSSAAAFLGVADLADSAFDEAMKADSADTDVVWWGLELYQPKWLGNPVKLRKVAEAAVGAADGWRGVDRVTTAIQLRQAGLIDLSTLMTKTPEEVKAVENAFAKPTK